MMDDFDIYADLPSIRLEECKEISDNDNINANVLKCQNLEKEVNELKSKLETLERLHNKLQINFSSLFKTAKAEICRKDRTISDLRLKLDNLILRRNRTQAHDKNAQPTVSKNKTNCHQENSFPPNLNYPPPEKPVTPNSENINQHKNNFTNSEDIMPDISHNIKHEKYVEDEETFSDKYQFGITKDSYNSAYKSTVYGERLRKKFFEEKEDELRKKDAKIHSLQKNENEDAHKQVHKQDNKSLETLNNTENFSRSHNFISEDINIDYGHKTSDLVRNSKSDDLLIEKPKYTESKEDYLSKYNNDTSNSNKYTGYNGMHKTNDTSNSFNRKSYHYSHSNYNSKDYHYQNYNNRSKLIDLKHSETSHRYSRHDKYSDYPEKYERHRSSHRYRSNDRDRCSDRQYERNGNKNYETNHIKYNKSSDSYYDRSPKRIKIYKTHCDYSNNFQNTEKYEKNCREKSESPKRSRSLNVKRTRCEDKEIPVKRQKISDPRTDIKSDNSSCKTNYTLVPISNLKEKVKDKVENNHTKLINSIDIIKENSESSKNLIVTNKSESSKDQSNKSLDAKSNKQYTSQGCEDVELKENCTKQDNFKTKKDKDAVTNTIISSNKDSADIDELNKNVKNSTISNKNTNQQEENLTILNDQYKIKATEVATMEMKIQKICSRETIESCKDLISDTATLIKNQQEETSQETKDIIFVNEKINKEETTGNKCALQNLNSDIMNSNKIIPKENLKTLDNCQAEKNGITVTDCIIKSNECSEFSSDEIEEKLKTIDVHCEMKQNNVILKQMSLNNDKKINVEGCLSKELELKISKASEDDSQMNNCKKTKNDKIAKNDMIIINSAKNPKECLKDTEELKVNEVSDTHSQVKQNSQDEKTEMNKQCKTEKNSIIENNISKNSCDKQINMLPMDIHNNSHKENSKKIINYHVERPDWKTSNSIKNINACSDVELNNIAINVTVSKLKENMKEEESKKIINQKQNTVIDNNTIERVEELEEGEILDEPACMLQDKNQNSNSKLNAIKTEVHSESLTHKQNTIKENSIVNKKSRHNITDNLGSSCKTTIKDKETNLVNYERKEKDMNLVRLRSRDSKNSEKKTVSLSLQQQHSSASFNILSNEEANVSEESASNLRSSTRVGSLKPNKGEINTRYSNNIDKETDELSLSKRILSSKGKIKKESNVNSGVTVNSEMEQNVEAHSFEENEQFKSHDKILNKNILSPLLNSKILDKNKDTCINTMNKSTIDYSNRKTVKNVIKIKCRRRQVQLSNSIPSLELGHASKDSNSSN